MVYEKPGAGKIAALPAFLLSELKTSGLSRKFLKVKSYAPEKA
jgi:hypothetical protein